MSYEWRHPNNPDNRGSDIPEDRQEPDFEPLESPEGRAVGVREWTMNRTIVIAESNQQDEWLLIKGMTPVDRRELR